MQQTIRVTGDADPDLAWDRYYRFERWSEWSPLIQSVENTGDHLEVGQTGTVRGPCRLGIEFSVTALNTDAKTWDWQVKVPLLGQTLKLHHGVSADKHGCATELVITGPAPLVLGYLPLARLALTRLVRQD